MIQNLSRAAKDFRDAEQSNGLGSAIVFGVFGVLFLLMTWGIGLLLGWDGGFLRILLGLMFLFIGIRIGAILSNAHEWGHSHIESLQFQAIRHAQHTRLLEIAKLYPNNVTIVGVSPDPLVTTTNLSTEAVEAIGGIDNNDLRAFLVQIVAWGKWTERVCENWILPSSGKKIGRDLYTKIMAQMVAAGNVTERGGDGNFTGKLTTNDIDLMLTRLRQTPSPTVAVMERK